MNCTKKHTNKISTEGKELTLEEKKNLNGGHVYIRANCGCFLRVKINGKAKTWKKQPEKVQIPFKYGLYEYGYITENDVVKTEIAG